MSLQKYQQLRNFKKTPEPKGGKKLAGKGPLRFVIHKHQASHLHFDLRLELNGVLKSWAVPKGINLNPAERHLAIMVEDHPWDYRTFEGIIPEGNYGAGTVMIWDEGNYTAAGTDDRQESEEKIEKGLEQGHISFILEGKKLKGEYALVKLPRSEKNEWLLVKKNDRFASDRNLEEVSAVTGRDMEEISDVAKKETEKEFSWPNLSELELPPEAKRSKMLRQVKPMAATLIEEPFDDKNWFFEVKWDGYRAIAEVNRGGARLYSRNNILLNKYFDELGKRFENFPGQAVLDGEIVVVDENGRSDFGRLQNFIKTGQGRPVYYLFDILFLNDYDLRGLPLWQRKEILRRVIPENLPDVKFTEYIEGRGHEMFKFAKDNMLEGILAKQRQSVYKDGIRSRDWLKIKNLQEQEAVIVGYTKPQGGRKYFGALVLGVYQNGKLVYIGHSGGGFTETMLASLKKRMDKLKTKESPLANPPEDKTITWIKPKLVCEVRFTEWTKENLMRQPVFSGLREDKKPEDVVKESPIESASNGSASRSEEQELKIGKLLVKVNHLSKVFWPKEKYTKKDLINYYRAVSGLILPYLKDRPESLHRHPNGAAAQGFFQKDINFPLPDWAQTVPIRSEAENKTVHYLLCQNEATLILMANLGCIEINPWASRYQKPEYPDYILFDLDPLDIAFEEVVRAAQTFHEVFEKIGIPHFCKTSGATGLHICVPLGAKYDYQVIREFGRLTSGLVNSLIPEFTSIERMPAKRKKKVYLDFLQNSEGQTMASAYCVRPRSGAPVSTPLEWKEVNKRLNPESFNLKTAVKRFDKKGDLWKGVLGRGIDIEKTLIGLQREYPSFFGT